MKRLTLLILLLALWAAPSWAAVTTQWAVGTTTTLLSTELNSLANNGYSSASATYDNRQGQTGNGYTACRLELNATFAANPTANTAVILWFLKSTDGGSTFENTPTSSVGLGRPPDVVFPVTTGQTGTRVSIDTLCPAERFKVSVKSDGVGQAMSASGNTVKLQPQTPQGN